MQKTVLAVEDDLFVLIFLEQELAERGYSVISASSGGEALHILSTGSIDIALLVTDISIGDRADGWEIARRARETDPNLPIIYITGGNARALSTEGVSGGKMLQKPFSRVDLAQAITSLFEETGK